MTITIDFSPTQAEQLANIAREEGVAPATLVQQLVAAHLPSRNPVAQVQALLAQWQAEDKSFSVIPSLVSQAGDDPTKALFRTWDEEDARMTDDERRAEDKLWQEFLDGLGETRAALGMMRLI